MKGKKILIASICFLLSASIVIAQTTTGGNTGTSTNTTTSTTKGDDPVRQPDGTYKTKKYNEADRPEDSYIAKFHAIDIVNKLMQKNLEQIYLLKVIVTNYKNKSGWNDKYTKIYDGYKEAMKLYYHRNVIYSRVKFEENKKAIQELLKEICDAYVEESKKILDQCATQIMLLHLDATTRSNPDKNRSLYLNQMRLRISYGQLDDAEAAMTDHVYDVGIYHLRVAKSYGIKILSELSKPEDSKKVLDQYKVDRADNLNRIFDAGETK